MLQLAIRCYVETAEPIKLAFDMNSLFDLFDTVLRPMPPKIRVLSRRMLSHIRELRVNVAIRCYVETVEQIVDPTRRVHWSRLYTS